MENSDLISLVRFFRTHKALHALEGFLLIAQGVDSASELRSRLDCTPSQANRIVNCLKGRGRYRDGRWLDSPFCLVEGRQHPHQRGQQLVLSSTGKQLLDPNSARSSAA